MPAQLLAAPVVFQASAGQVWWPNSLGRDRMKCPAKLARTHIVGANISIRCRQTLRYGASEEEQIFVDRSGAGYRKGNILLRPFERLAQIDSPMSAKIGVSFASFCVDAEQFITGGYEDSCLRCVRPVGQASISIGRTTFCGLKAPNLFPVAASRATTCRLGVVTYITPSMTIGLH